MKDKEIENYAGSREAVALKLLEQVLIISASTKYQNLDPCQKANYIIQLYNVCLKATHGVQVDIPVIPDVK